jgi:hypothetical protein
MTGMEENSPVIENYLKNFTRLEDMPEEMLKKCFDTNNLFGTERW